MTFDDLKDQIADGDLLLFRGRAWYSWIIRLRTNSVYTHVGVAGWITIRGRRILCCLEAMEGKGLRAYPLERYINDGVVVDWFRVDDSVIDRAKVIDWWLERLGNDYASPWQMARSFFLLTSWVCDWLRIPHKIDVNRYFCNLAALLSLVDGGYPHSDVVGKPLEYTSPGELARLPKITFQWPLLPTKDSKR